MILKYLEEKCDLYGVDYDHALEILTEKHTEKEPTKSQVTRLVKSLVKAQVNEEAISEEYDAVAEIEKSYLGRCPVTGEKKYS